MEMRTDKSIALRLSENPRRKEGRKEGRKECLINAKEQRVRQKGWKIQSIFNVSSRGLILPRLNRSLETSGDLLQ